MLKQEWLLAMVSGRGEASAHHQEASQPMDRSHGDGNDTAVILLSIKGATGDIPSSEAA